jgi:hypothetical protein
MINLSSSNIILSTQCSFEKSNGLQQLKNAHNQALTFHNFQDPSQPHHRHRGRILHRVQMVTLFLKVKI